MDAVGEQQNDIALAHKLAVRLEPLDVGLGVIDVRAETTTRLTKLPRRAKEEEGGRRSRMSKGLVTQKSKSAERIEGFTLAFGYRL